MGDLRWVWAGVQLYSSVSRPTQQRYGLSMTNETDSDRERDTILCVYVRVCLGLTLYSFFLRPSLYTSFIACLCVCVCVCAHFLSWPLKKRDKTTVKTNRGKWADNRKRECVCVCTSPHCLQKHKVDIRGKIDCNNREEDSLLLLLPPLSVSTSLYLFLSSLTRSVSIFL